MRVAMSRQVKVRVEGDKGRGPAGYYALGPVPKVSATSGQRTTGVQSYAFGQGRDVWPIFTDAEKGCSQRVQLYLQELWPAHGRLEGNSPSRVRPRLSPKLRPSHLNNRFELLIDALDG